MEMVKVDGGPCLEAAGDTSIDSEPPQCLLMELLCAHVNVPGRPHYQAAHRHPRSFCATVHRPASFRWRGAVARCFEPPSTTAQLVPLAQEPLTTGPPHEQARLVAILVDRAPVGQAGLWGVYTKLVRMQSVRGAIAVSVDHEQKRAC